MATRRTYSTIKSLDIDFFYLHVVWDFWHTLHLMLLRCVAYGSLELYGCWMFSAACRTKDKFRYWLAGQLADVTDHLSEMVWKVGAEEHPMPYHLWGPGEPNSNADNIEACLAMWVDDGGVFKWNDLFCDMTRCPICEID